MSSLPALWQTTNPGLATLALDTTQGHSGSASAKISASTGTSGTKSGFFLTPVIPIVPATKYTLSYWAKATGDAGGVSQGIVVYNDADDNFLTSDAPSPIPAGDSGWTRYSVTSLVPAGAAYAQIFLVTYANPGSVWFDDISLALPSSRNYTLPLESARFASALVAQASSSISSSTRKTDVVGTGATS